MKIHKYFGLNLTFLPEAVVLAVENTRLERPPLACGYKTVHRSTIPVSVKFCHGFSGISLTGKDLRPSGGDNACQQEGEPSDGGKRSQIDRYGLALNGWSKKGFMGLRYASGLLHHWMECSIGPFECPSTWMPRRSGR
ncbi:hypothetical protein TNIN_468141 [Trichonephila inaurata madagascariensis]|uniref:Uncharacterized protein n=1 Tax=Trichonephila inaurata madagascariensis TaxID=2747483 RepID=A0A8X6X7S6_9ARAC|nr:hypothetical protein TNIN_468141 [Trichonephila inaurata madagascariensis]